MIKDQDGLKRLKERLSEIAGHRGDYRERLEFYGKVLGFVSERRAELEPVATVDEGEAAERLKAGFVLLDEKRIVFDEEWLGKSLNGLWELTKTERGLPAESVALFERSRKEAGSLAELVTSFARGGSFDAAWEKSLGGDTRDLWEFLARNATRGWFEQQAAACVGLESLETWVRGTCPVCGGAAAFEAFLGEEGKKRVLLCHRCGFEWQYRRVACPFCENTNHDTLSYIGFEEEPLYRVDVCDACKGYVKGLVDPGRDTRPALEAEDLGTPHLDLIATREGYEKKSPNSLGLRD